MNQGGSYIVRKKGDEPELLERTEDHPEGNRPRNEKGEALDIAEAKKAAKKKTTKKKSATSAASSINDVKE